MKTRVIFFYEKDSNIEVFAYFPDDNADYSGNKTSYSHIGQHSACSPDYVKECKLAGVFDYVNLILGLEDIGYNLDILNEREYEYHRNPTPGEIRFGEGATHYKNFPFELVYKRDKDLEFKIWIKGPYDGLRYYR